MITATLDPAGTGVIHKVHPAAKLAWLLLITLAATLSEDLLYQFILFVQCAVFYGLVRRGKRSPAPPIFLIVLSVAGLLFVLNALFGESPIGRWGYVSEITEGEGGLLSPSLDLALMKSLRLGATMLAVVVFLLSTIPRDLARMLERLKFPVWLTESTALALHFLPVLEINLRLLGRAADIRFPRPWKEGTFRGAWLYGQRFAYGALVTALGQALSTGDSLTIRGFAESRRRVIDSRSFNLVWSTLVAILGLASLAGALLRQTRL